MSARIWFLPGGGVRLTHFVSGQEENAIARLHADGHIDPAAAFRDFPDSASAVAILPPGHDNLWDAIGWDGAKVIVDMVKARALRVAQIQQQTAPLMRQAAQALTIAQGTGSVAQAAAISGYMTAIQAVPAQVAKDLATSQTLADLAAYVPPIPAAPPSVSAIPFGV